MGLALSGCDLYQIANAVGLCKDTIVLSAISPNHQYIATVYQRDCGATTDTTTYVNIRPSMDRFKGEGKNSIFAVEWIVPTAVVWEGDSNLVIKCIGRPNEKVFRQENAWRDVSISYRSYGKIATSYR